VRVPFTDRTPDLKRRLADVIAPELDGWNGDDIGSRLGINRSRVADLRAKKLERFSLHALVRIAARLNYQIELRITKVERPYAKRSGDLRQMSTSKRPSTSEG
jgi:hypothetical protein